MTTNSSSGNKDSASKGHCRVNLQAVLADPVRRRELMASVIVATQAREGLVTTRGLALAAYDKVQLERRAHS